jgi:hypothetical protein
LYLYQFKAPAFPVDVLSANTTGSFGGVGAGVPLLITEV